MEKWQQMTRLVRRLVDRRTVRQIEVERTKRASPVPLSFARFITGFAGCLFDIRNDRQGRLYELYPVLKTKMLSREEGFELKNFVNVT